MTACAFQRLERPRGIAHLLEHVGHVQCERAALEVVIEGRLQGDQCSEGDRGRAHVVRRAKHLSSQASVRFQPIGDVPQCVVDLVLQDVAVGGEQLDDEPVSRDAVRGARAQRR